MANSLDSEIPEFDAWQDDVEHSHPSVQFFWRKEVPEKIDWRKEKNVVTPVKKQGKCGACWAFTTAGVLEGSYAIKTGKRVELSE